MLLVAIILSIDYNKNTCIINIPALQTAANAEPVPQEAVLVTLPGLAGGYSAGDSVWVGFYNGQKEHPVVLGKTVNEQTAASKGGAFFGNSLTVSDKVILPSEISFTGIDADYNSFVKITNKLRELTNFLERNANLEYRLKQLEELEARVKNLEQNGLPGTPTPEPESTPDLDTEDS